MQLVFFTAVVLCFGFITKMVLMTHWCFSYCWVSRFSVSYAAFSWQWLLRVGKIMGDTNQSGQLTRTGLRGISYYMIYWSRIKTKVTVAQRMVEIQFVCRKLWIVTAFLLFFAHLFPSFLKLYLSPWVISCLALLVLFPILLDRGTEWAT